MLVLTRKEGEQIRIGDDIIITVVRSGGGRIRLGIEAPPDKVILRSELREQGYPAISEKTIHEAGFPLGLTESSLSLPFAPVSPF